MTDLDAHQRRTWKQKFRDAFRGIGFGIEGESSFAVHFAVALIVLVAGAVLRVTRMEWCLLIGCIFMVLSAEMFNSALEAMAKALEDKYNPQLGAALDIASAAVLMAAIGASLIGAVIFLYRLLLLFGWAEGFVTTHAWNCVPLALALPVQNELRRRLVKHLRSQWH